MVAEQRLRDDTTDRPGADNKEVVADGWWSVP